MMLVLVTVFALIALLVVRFVVASLPGPFNILLLTAAPCIFRLQGPEARSLEALSCLGGNHEAKSISFFSLLIAHD